MNGNNVNGNGKHRPQITQIHADYGERTTAGISPRRKDAKNGTTRKMRG